MKTSQEPNDVPKEYNKLVEEDYQLTKKIASNEHRKNGFCKFVKVST
jgi:hypothetical protein